MFRAFFGELGHLALIHTGVDSIAARLDPLLDQLRQQQIIPLVQTLWCSLRGLLCGVRPVQVKLETRSNPEAHPPEEHKKPEPTPLSLAAGLDPV